MPRSCKTILDRMVHKGAMTQKDHDKIVRNLIRCRCKDCKWFGELGCAINIVDDTDKPQENDFCSFAERKKGTDDAEVGAV